MTHDITTVNNPDISKWLQHSWYDLVYYRDSKDSFPLDEGENIGLWHGVSHLVGKALCYWILPVSGIPIYHTTVRPIPHAEMRSPDFIKRAEAFDKAIIETLGDPRIPNNEALEDMQSLFDEKNYN